MSKNLNLNTLLKAVGWSILASFLKNDLYLIDKEVNFSLCYALESEFHNRGSYNKFNDYEIDKYNYIFIIVREFLIDYHVNKKPISLLFSRDNIISYYDRIIQEFNEGKLVIGELPSSLLEAKHIYGYSQPLNNNNLDSYV